MPLIKDLCPDLCNMFTDQATGKCERSVIFFFRHLTSLMQNKRKKVKSLLQIIAIDSKTISPHQY